MLACTIKTFLLVFLVPGKAECKQLLFNLIIYDNINSPDVCSIYLNLFILTWDISRLQWKHGKFT